MTAQRYDYDLHMWVDPPRNLDMSHLIFLRKLAKHGLLEHGVAGIPSGDCLDLLKNEKDLLRCLR